MKMSTAAAIASLMLFASPALAQTPTTPSPPAVSPTQGAQPQWYSQQGNEMRASKLIGTTVKNDANESIGSINEVVLGKDGKLAAVVIGVGGFLGIGEKSVALKLDRLQIMPDPQTGAVALVMDAKKEELANTPSFKSKRDQDSERQAMERARNQPQGGGMTKPGKNN